MSTIFALSGLYFSINSAFNSWENNYYHPGDFFIDFIYLPLDLAVFFLPLALAITAYALRKSDGWWMAIPVAISFLASFEMMRGASTYDWLKYNDGKFGAARAAFVRQVMASPPKSSVENFYDNTLSYPSDQMLSIGGEAVFYKVSEKGVLLLFMTFEGIPDGFSGFLYAPSEIDPKKEWPEANFEWADVWDNDRHIYFVGNR